jgi:RNA polymerase-binding transcription factor
MRKSKPSIPRKALAALRGRLLERQRTLFHEVDGVEEDLRTIEQSQEPEAEERGQGEAMARLLDRLREHDRRELEEIHRALTKIPAGAYGRCESCGKPIGLARLEAAPAAQRCVDCELRRETHATGASLPSQPTTRARVPSEYRDLDDAELAEAVRERVSAHGDPDFAQIEIRCHSGVVRLSGEIPSEAQREVLRQIIADGMGLEVVDRLRAVEVERELPGEQERPAEAPPIAEEERIPAGRGMQPLRSERWSVPDDEGEPPETPPDRPLPEKE